MGRDAKPDKPYPDFPLYAHATRRWAKKIRGKLYYFGPWDDWRKALDTYQDQRDDLYAGRKPRQRGEGLVVKDLCNRFMTAKQRQRDTGEITRRSFDEYYKTCDRLVKFFGAVRLVTDLDASDFEKFRAELAVSRGPVSLSNEIGRVRVVFKYATDNHLVPVVAYGQGFKRPSKLVLRKEKARRGVRMFEADELRRVLAVADPTMKAMVLLGVNCGFGNHDVGSLAFHHLDLPGGWGTFPRPKTGAPRRCKLWPETVQALQEAIRQRYEPRDEQDAGLVFVTKYKQSWAKETRDNPVSVEFRKLLQQIDADAEQEASKTGVTAPEKLYRPGRGFYALRHTFETIGGESRDQVAVDFIMGHAKVDMATVYRERISDERLENVANVVRVWLFGEQASKQASRRKRPAKKREKPNTRP